MVHLRKRCMVEKNGVFMQMTSVDCVRLADPFEGAGESGCRLDDCSSDIAGDGDGWFGQSEHQL